MLTRIYYARDVEGRVRRKEYLKGKGGEEEARENAKCVDDGRLGGRIKYLLRRGRLTTGSC